MNNPNTNDFKKLPTNDSEETPTREHFLKELDISAISQSPNKVILKRHRWFEQVMKLPSGTNVYQASKILQIPYTTLNDFLRMLDFCQLIRLYTSIENGRAVKIIDNSVEEKQ